MYGQNITPSVRKEARKKSAVIANGSPSRCLPTPAAMPARASTPITGNTSAQGFAYKLLRASTL